MERADISIVNFESPIIKEGKTPKPITKCGPNLKGSIEAIDAIKYAGFNCCTLANNHILDQGADCCMDTIECLKSKGLLTVGAGNNIDDASEILYFESEGIKLVIINCCEHEFTLATDESPGANPLNPIQQFYKIIEAKKNADIVMAIIHGEPEFYQLPTIRMQETYRYFIDCGADIVVNHHQHCFGGYEIYKDKTIFYGLGNLCFDDIIKKDGTWVEGYMLEFDISVDKSINFKLYPYKQCSDEVGVHLLQDACDFEKKSTS